MAQVAGRADRLSVAGSFLFVPGDDEAKLRKACSGSADVVIADLEDSVPESSRPGARQAIARIVEECREPSGPLLMLRVGRKADSIPRDDLALATELELDAIVVPKASPEDLERLPGRCPAVVALIESARGLRGAFDLISDERVEALALGAVDLSVDLRLAPVPGCDLVEPQLLVARSELVTACAAAAARAPIDGVAVDFEDLDGFRRTTLAGRALGMRGRLCIHPAQVDVVNAHAGPSRKEIDWARRVLAAYRQVTPIGVVAIEGSMADEAVAKRAEQVLAEAEDRGVR